MCPRFGDMSEKVCPRFGDRCKFGSGCRHKNYPSKPFHKNYHSTLPTPLKPLHLRFYDYEYPKGEDYLGRPGGWMCSHCDCELKGYIFSSRELKKSESFHMPQVEIKKGTLDIQLSVGDEFVHESFERDDESKEIWSDMFHRFFLLKYKKTLYKDFLSKKYPEAKKTYKV